MKRMGKKVSPPKRPNVWRPNPAKRICGGSSFALNKAAKALASVESVSTIRGNIKVVVRVRPANSRESTVNSRNVVIAVDSHMVVFDPPDDESPEFYFKGVKQNYQQGKRNKNIKLAFDNVYGPQSSNEEIFDEVINPMLDTLLNGFNCSVFAYGATGSGKTHTMIGSMDNPGLTYQTVMELYRRLGDMEKDYETEVVVSYLEVYNESIRDLLSTPSGDLQLREDANGVIVANLTTHKPKDSTDLLQLLAQGNSVRSQHPTDHNSESSRSHAVFQVFVKLRSRFTELTSKYKSAKLVMVDLAGSEKGAATNFHGQRFREGASINKSLLSLGNCINALVDGKKHIPYRDSKLTRILKDSLEGNCKTVMIANVSPSSLSYDDSYNTLRYADRAKRIKFQLKKNTMSVSACLTQYTIVVEEMSNKIAMLEKELSEYKDKCNLLSSVQKVDATTETETTTSISSSLFPQQANTIPIQVTECCIPLPVVERLSAITATKETVLRTLGEASSVYCASGIKISLKEKRIHTIKKLKFAGEDRMEKQIEPLMQRHTQAKKKRNEAQHILTQLDEEVDVYARQYANKGNEYIPIRVSEFFEFHNLKSLNARLMGANKATEEYFPLFVDDVQKSEALLRESLEFMNSQYLLTKHYKNNTKQMDASYEKIVGGLYGKTVHWSDDMDLQYSRVDPLSTFFEGNGNAQNIDPCAVYNNN